MVKKLRLSLILFLTFAVLVSSTGLTVFKMTCLKNGKAYQSLQQFNTCCKTEHDQTTVDSQCCEYSKITYKVDLLQKTTNPIFKVESPLVADLFANPLFQRYLSTIPPTNPYDSPPPPNGRALLTIQSILII